MTTYVPSEFIQKLAANDLPDDDEVKIAGLVKHAALSASTTATPSSTAEQSKSVAETHPNAPASLTGPNSLPR